MLENLNVTNSNKVNSLNCLDKLSQDKEKFRCYKCDNNFMTLSTLMYHKKNLHKIRTKCRNIVDCKYNDNCWYSHEEDDTDSIRTHNTD